MRHLAWLVCLPLLGCQSFGPAELGALSGATIAIHRLVPATWARSIGADDPILLSASRALERGDHDAACARLSEYADRHPDSRQARVFYAEVLFKLGKQTPAMLEFEKAIALMHDDRTVDLGLLVHCHGRLLDIADADADEYSVHLHRGLGLYWLAQQPRSGEESDAANESLLFKTAMELLAAHAVAPHEARPMWYLHLTWRQLGQSAPADRWLRQAREAEPFCYLTPRERIDLMLQHRP